MSPELSRISVVFYTPQNPERSTPRFLITHFARDALGPSRRKDGNPPSSAPLCVRGGLRSDRCTSRQLAQLGLFGSSSSCAPVWPHHHRSSLAVCWPNWLTNSFLAQAGWALLGAGLLRRRAPSKEPATSKPRNIMTITPTTAARLLLACFAMLSPVCTMRSQALSTQPVILELDEQGTPPGASGAWPRASTACSLVPPNFPRFAIAVDPMPRPSCPCSVGAPKCCFPEP